MLAVSLNAADPGAPSVELTDLTRPVITQPTDVVLMVTTTAIGRWEIAQARNGNGDSPTPGAEFAGVVVETGEAVTNVNLDDLVVATFAVQLTVGGHWRFGQRLPGGHGEYVLVPNADQALVRTTPGAEERSVFAGGSASLGIAAAEMAIESAGDRPVMVVGCDSAGLSALAWLRHKRGRDNTVYAVDQHPARLAAAKTFGANSLSIDEIRSSDTAAVIVAPDVLAMGRPNGAHIISTDPNNSMPGLVSAVLWPDVEQAKRAEMAIRLRQIDLTALVSTVVPLDEATEGYRVATEDPPGTRCVLLKP